MTDSERLCGFLLPLGLPLERIPRGNPVSESGVRVRRLVSPVLLA